MKLTMRIFFTLAALLQVATPSHAEEDDGKIMNISKDSITIGKKHPGTYKICTATAISLNGDRTTTAALHKGMRATVVFTAGAASNITAITDSSSLNGATLEMKPKKK